MCTVADRSNAAYWIYTLLMSRSKAKKQAIIVIAGHKQDALLRISYITLFNRIKRIQMENNSGTHEIKLNQIKSNRIIGRGMQFNIVLPTSPTHTHRPTPNRCLLVVQAAVAVSVVIVMARPVAMSVTMTIAVVVSVSIPIGMMTDLTSTIVIVALLDKVVIAIERIEVVAAVTVITRAAAVRRIALRVCHHTDVSVGECEPAAGRLQQPLARTLVVFDLQEQELRQLRFLGKQAGDFGSSQHDAFIQQFASTAAAAASSAIATAGGR